MSNAKGQFNDDNKEENKTITINSIDRTIFVERLPNPHRIHRNWMEIIPYGLDNLYPNKILSIVQRSSSTLGAAGTMADFITGEGFGEDLNKEIINNEGQTLWHILRYVSNQKSIFKGISLHLDYNKFGEITSINEIAFENLRYSKELNMYVFSHDWPKHRVNDKIYYFPFNNDPQTVKEQINLAGGIDKYPGQIFYWIPNKKDIYCLAECDSVIDDSQFEAETKLYKLSNVQYGYSSEYIFVYPKQIESSEEMKNVKDEIKKGSGSVNAGKTLTLGIPFNEDTSNHKFIHEIPRTGIDKLFEKQNKETKDSIYACYKQPKILNGISKEGGFSKDEYIDSFDYYNSFVENHRKDIEQIFNKVLENSIFNFKELKLIPKDFIVKRTTQDKINYKKTEEQEVTTDE